MSVVLESGAGICNISWDQETFDVVWELEENLPLTGSFNFIVEKADKANVATATCTIIDAGVPDVSPGKVRTVITPVVMKTIVGKHTYSFRHIVTTDVNEYGIAKGEFMFNRTAL